MRKQFLLGLMAMLLPLTMWAAESDPVLNQFVVTLTDDLEGKTEVDYTGSVTVGVKVTYSYKTPEKIETSELTEGTHFTVSYDYTPFVGVPQTGLTAAQVKDAGSYTVNVTGIGDVYAGESGTATFTINRVPLTLTDAIVKEGARIQYGTTDNELENLNIADFITLGDANGLKNTTSQLDAELADALKCLSLTYATRANEEGAKGAALLKVIANSSNASTNYKYSGDGVYVKVDIDKKVLTLSLNQASREYDGTTTTAQSLVKGLDFVEGDNVQATYTVTKGNKNADIKNAGEYSIKVDLAGDDKDNYEFNGNTTFTYTINRKTINIKTNEGVELTKVYDGEVVSAEDVANCFTIDSAVEGDNITIAMLPSGGTKDRTDAESEVSIAPYVNGEKQIQSKNWGAPETDWKDAPEALSNYKITIDSKATSSALPKFTITKRPVLFYFAGINKVYQKTAITNETLKNYYTVEVLTKDGTGFVTHTSTSEDVEPTTDAFKQAPVAKFAGEITEAKKIDTYDLTWDEETNVTYSDDKTNYKAIFVDEENEEYGDLLEGKENANVFEITKRELTITALNTTIAYGAELSTLDDYLTISAAKVQAEGKTVEGANIERGLVAEAADFTPILKKLGEKLVIDEDVDLTTVGTKEGVIKFSVDESVFADDETYNITLKAGNLIVVGKDEITLDAIAEEGEEDNVYSQVYAYNGQEVGVRIKNLMNNTTGTISENGQSADFVLDQTIYPERWYTLVLPFDIKVSDLSKLFGYAIVNIPDVDNTNQSAVNFKLWMQTVPANTLMAFKVSDKMEWNGEELENGIDFGKRIIKAPVSEEGEYDWATDKAGNKFIGVYEMINIKNEKEYFWNARTGKAAPSSLLENGVDIYPLNGYVSAVSNNARIFMEEADGSTTAISLVTGETVNYKADGWYTVGGVKLNGEPTEKGVYINNGKKVVIK